MTPSLRHCTIAVVLLVMSMASVGACRAQATFECEMIAGVPTVLSSWIDEYGMWFLGKGSVPDDRMADVLGELNALIKTDTDVVCIRRWTEDDPLVDALLPIATGLQPRARVNARLVLENIVDNTNICRVLARLAGGGAELGADARYGLLMVVWQVSHYAYLDTEKWIVSVLDLTDQSLDRLDDVAKTQSFVSEIRGILQGRQFGMDKNLEGQNPAKFQQCETILAPYLVAPTNV